MSRDLTIWIPETHTVRYLRFHHSDGYCTIFLKIPVVQVKMSWYTKKSAIFFFLLVCHEKINLYFSFRQVANYGGGRASASPNPTSNPMSVNVTSNRSHDQSVASNRPQDRMMQLQEQRRQIEQRTVASTHNSRKNFLATFSLHFISADKSNKSKGIFCHFWLLHIMLFFFFFFLWLATWGWVKEKMTQHLGDLKSRMYEYSCGERAGPADQIQRTK